MDQDPSDIAGLIAGEEAFQRQWQSLLKLFNRLSPTGMRPAFDGARGLNALTRPQPPEKSRGTFYRASTRSLEVSAFGF